MKIPRRKFLRLAAGVAVLPAMSRASTAQDYPTRPIRLIVGFQPGTAPDVIARLLGQRLAEQLGKSVIIENHAGAVSGHKTKIAKLAIDWGWTPHMHLEDVELSNADWGKADHMFKAQQIEFDIHLWSLLHGDLVLPHLMLRKP